MSDYDFSNASISNLQMRQALGRWIIRKIRSEWRHEEEWADTWLDALRKNEAIVKAITLELRRRRKAKRAEAGEDKPPATVVKMKPATLGAKTKRR